MDHPGSDPGIEHEEHHAADGDPRTDRSIHGDPASSELEANMTRPAGDDLKAEEAAARGYDPAYPPPPSAADDRL